MDDAGFLKNERPGEFEALFSVRGEIRMTIKAESLDDAKAKAAAMLEDENFGTEIDGVDDIEIERVWKSPTMYLVNRAGEVMQTSHLQDGDIPREPNERGF